MELENLKILCFKLKEQKKIMDEFDKKKKEAGAILDKMKAEMLAHLEEHKLKNFDFGEGKVVATNKFSITILDKHVFASYLRSIDKFDSLYTFNSNTINSFYKECLEEAIDAGDSDFKIEGLSEPSVYRYLKLLK